MKQRLGRRIGLEPYIDTEAYREEIEEILKRYGLTPSNVDYAAPNIREYCRVNNFRLFDKEIYTEVPESRTAMNFRRDSPDRCKILLKKYISPGEVFNVLGGMIARGFSHKTHHLEDKWFFVKHLVLHEICEVLEACDPQCGDKEAACDDWAFREMGL
jgi:hypothetical protein